MKKSYIVLILMAVCVICSCSKGGSNEVPVVQQQPPVDKDPDPTPTPVLIPGKSTAILPENGDLCSTYSEIANDDQNITVAFQWSAADNSTSYKIQVLESTTEVYSATSSSLEMDITLNKGKAYSWQITSVNSDGETISDTFSFSTPGNPTTNYVPYAAEISMDFDANANTLTINWVGSDEDGDSLVYDLQIKEDDTEIVSEVDLTANSYGPINVTSGKTYTVEVSSKDPSGNVSVSNQFRVFQ